MSLKQIEDVKDIHLLVDTFYSRIRKDELLGPIFEEKIQDWPSHLETLYHFWQNALLKDPVYHGTPLSSHENLPVSNPHFYRWVTLFNQTVDDLFEGPLADQAKFFAMSTSESIRNKISSVRF